MDAESLLNLEADLPDVEAFVRDRGSRLDVDANARDVYWLVTTPPVAPDEVFFVRIGWSAYPFAPPSVKFAETIGGSLSVTKAWPAIPGYRPGSFDICKPFTAEAFNIHPEWRTSAEAWRTTGNPFLWVVQVILEDFANHYGGRSA